jgi:iron(III) transport system substrate-binding protein
MMKRNTAKWCLVCLPLLLISFVGISASPAEEVVVYTSVDQVFSEPVLNAFEKKTGIKVKALYDVEAAKTVGLVNRLIAEKPNPKADVFWNSEVSRTILLKKKEILSPYRSVHWDVFPGVFKDKETHWTGFSARARILIYNTTLVKEKDAPESIFDLVKPAWKKKVTIAYPLFGTTATHVAALYTALGPQKTEDYLRGLVKNEVLVVDGNSVTRDLVVEGRAAVGFTDTDDAQVAIAKGKPVKTIYPDKKGIGTLLIPNTVALVKKGPNPQSGKKLIDFLLSEEVESLLAFGEAAQMPLRKGVKKPSTLPDISEIKALEVDYSTVAENIEKASKFCQELFIKR